MQSPSPVERRISLLILGILVLIGGGIVIEQSKFDPSQWQERSDHNRAFRHDVSPGKDKDAVAGLEPMSPPERYDAESLSDKINGKAELYLGAGFQHLESRRYSLPGDPDSWMERFVYNMGAQRNAFAVFSAQRRKTSAPLDLAVHGYLSFNGLFFVHGPYYIEIIAAQATEGVQEHMEKLAAHFVATHDFPAEALEELGLFPPEHQVPESATLIADSAFGLEGLDWVFTATYQSDGAEATAFISRRGSAAEAESRAAAFTAHWSEYGGEMVTPPVELRDADVVTIMENFEIVVAQGRYIVGVHEATHLDFGADVTARLLQTLKEKAP